LGLLEGRGLVTKRDDLPERGPRRIVYSITEQGRADLRRWLAEPAAKEDVRYEILVKLFFGAGSTAEQNLAVIDSFRGRNAAQLAVLRQFKRQLGAILGESDDHLYYYLTVLFGEKVYQAYLDWAEEAKDLLIKRNMQSPGSPKETT
jgi:DNA-binding MarR family transcriptional regulator